MAKVTLIADEEGALERSLELYNDVHPDDPQGLDEARSYAGNVPHFGVFLAELDGTAAGGAHAAIESDNPAEARVAVYVLEGARRRGVGSVLLAECSRWTRARGGKTMRGAVAVDDAASLSWAQARGFEKFSRETILELPIDALDAPEPEPPAGMEIVTWADRPELAEGIYAVALEAWPDIPGGDTDRVGPYEEWMREHMHGAGDRPDATFVALAGDQVVGYSKFSLPGAQPGVAWHDLTAVKRAWRGRGIARALKATQIAWARREGYERLRTVNEERNAPIQRLNAEFGYRPAGGRIRLRGPLLGA